MSFTRRHALLGGLAGAATGCATSLETGRFESLNRTADGVFAHGVASGDPMADSVVLWTRVTTKAPVVSVTVEVAADAAFSRTVFTQRTETDAARDHTVKIIADGLSPGQTYYYRFRAGDAVSPSGRTKTLPESAREARFAVVSCSNYPFGYFNAYDHIARDQALDAVIHLGDYIYEYGTEGYGAKAGRALGRTHLPAHEILTLADYRTRHAQYKNDPASRAMHAAHPLIAIWDDHETSNDSWQGGAENHDPATEGNWDNRRRAALQAYYEWMPVRDPQPGRAREDLYRAYRWGGLLTLTKIETRLTARTKQIDYADAADSLTSPDAVERFRRDVIGAPDRQLLGPDQRAQVAGALGASVDRGEPWRMVANQIIMARITAPNLEPYTDEAALVELEKEWDQARAFVKFTTLGLPLNMDAWDGYPAARAAFYAAARDKGATDLIVLTGDTHEFWGNDLYDDDDRPMGVELGTSGVTSPGPSGYLGDKAFDYSLLLRRENRDVRFHDPLHRGYIRLTLTEDRGTADFVALSTIASPNYDAFVNARFDLVRDKGSVRFANARGLGFKERVVY